MKHFICKCAKVKVKTNSKMVVASCCGVNIVNDDTSKPCTESEASSDLI